MGLASQDRIRLVGVAAASKASIAPVQEAFNHECHFIKAGKKQHVPGSFYQMELCVRKQRPQEVQIITSTDWTSASRKVPTVFDSPVSLMLSNPSLVMIPSIQLITGQRAAVQQVPRSGGSFAPASAEVVCWSP